MARFGLTRTALQGPVNTIRYCSGRRAADRATVTGKTFFPHLISGPFLDGLRIAFSASLVMCLIAAAASWLRGGRYVHDEGTGVAEAPSIPDTPVPA